MGWVIALVLSTFVLASHATAADIEFVTENLPWAIADRPYSPPPLQSRGSGECLLDGVGYGIVSGVLPPGIQMSRLGYFSGTPARTGAWEIGVRVSNGCSWTARHFVLTVTGAPVLTATPDRLVFQAVSGGPLSPEETLHVSATWPRLNYMLTAIPVSPAEPARADWLKIQPEHGFTPRESSALTEDAVHVRADPSGLKPGRYSARIVISAWEALEARVIDVELTVTASASGIPTSASR